MAPSSGIFAGGVSADVHFKGYRRECARYQLAACAWPAFDYRAARAKRGSELTEGESDRDPPGSGCSVKGRYSDDRSLTTA
jgi:hypothetical protein